MISSPNGKYVDPSPGGASVFIFIAWNILIKAIIPALLTAEALLVNYLSGVEIAN